MVAVADKQEKKKQTKPNNTNNFSKQYLNRYVIEHVNTSEYNFHIFFVFA